MRITHVCPNVGEQMGGSERYVANLSAIQSSDFDVHIHTTTRNIGNAGITTRNGITFHRYYSPANVWNINPLSFMLRGLTHSDSDIFHIHSYLYFSSNQAILAKVLKMKKSILQIHGGIGLPPYRIALSKRVAKQFYDKTLGRMTIKHSDIVASVSRTDLEYLEQRFGFPKSKLSYLQNAVDTQLFTPKRKHIESNQKTVLYLGDLEPWKGVGLLINWLEEKTTWDGFEVKFCFVGQGSLQTQLAALMKKVKKYENGTLIEVLGPRKHCEIPSILQNADALVLPSYWEGMPTVVLEAMAAGVPVISTRVGDIPLLIEDGKDGILIKRSQNSFRSAIQLLLGDQSLARRIASSARQLVKDQFSLTMMGRTASRLYRDLLM